LEEDKSPLTGATKKN